MVFTFIFDDYETCHLSQPTNSGFYFLFFLWGDAECQRVCVTSGWPFCDTASLLVQSRISRPFVSPCSRCDTIDLLMHRDTVATSTEVEEERG